MSKITDVGAALDPQFEKVEMSNNLRTAAKAALLALKCLDGLECAREEIEALEAALAEPDVQESLTGAEQKPMLEMNPQKKREWVGLTGTEINHIFAANVGYPERMMKEVETLLKEKNT